MIQLGTLLFIVFITAFGWAVPASKAFKLHLYYEPLSFDPAHVGTASGQYLFSNLYRGLMHIDGDNKLVADGAKGCRWASSLKVICDLRRDRKFSDGTSMTSKYYVTALRRHFSSSVRSVQTENLLALKNAKKILAGKAQPEQLGVRAKGDHSLVFQLSEPDSDFLYRLASPGLTAIASDVIPDRSVAHTWATTGPYMIKKWAVGRRISLKSNPHYPGHEGRPAVEFLFVQNDAAAIRLFEGGQLNFLRRIASAEVGRFKDRTEFFFHPVWRFDYLGFSGDLKKLPKFREALALSLNYKDMQKLFAAPGTPGCVGFPGELYGEKTPLCIKFDKTKAKKSLEQVKLKELKTKRNLLYTKVTGEDGRKWVEWVQYQWKRNLGYKVSIDPIEAGMYRHSLMQPKAHTFRKSIPLDRPTCLSAVEVFKSDSPDNVIQLKDSKIDALINKLKAERNPKKSKPLCQKIVRRLMDNFHMVPMGDMQWAMVHDGQFGGWSLNNLNELDLTGLRAVSK